MLPWPMPVVMKGVKMDYKLGLVAKDIQNSVTPTVYGAFATDLGLEISFNIMNIPENELSDTCLLYTSFNNLIFFKIMHKKSL